MFKKLRDKITEEVQQTSLRLPVSVQHLSQLSPFSGSGGDLSDFSRSPQNGLQDELLVDISEIQPAGDNKDLFSIDEDSREGTPSKSSEFQVVELADENNGTTSPTKQDDVHSELYSHNTYNPTSPGITTAVNQQLPVFRRRNSDVSSTSDVSGLFPIYEIPGVSFNLPQHSDLESCSSEWEDGNSSLDRLSKDTVYQAYLRMRQRYHKYKGRYSDIVRAYQEKEKETEKLRDVLTKQQDKAVRRVSELREQCSLEQQAKAHLEQELRSDLEEKDHKIEALQTKVRLLQEGYMAEEPYKPNPPVEKVDEEEHVSVPIIQVDELNVGNSRSNHEDFDNVSVGSLGSISTAPTSLESEELIDKLKSDLVKHKTLLGRCMENIRANKERISALIQERDNASAQLQEKVQYIDVQKVDHEKMLESLKASVESSSLSMAETKKQLFEELQTKEAEVEHYKNKTELLEQTIEKQKEQIERQKEQIEKQKEQIEESKILSDEEQEINLEEEQPESLSLKEELEKKCTELEKLVADLQNSKKNLEIELESLKGHKKMTAEEEKQSMTDKQMKLELETAEMNRNIEELNEKLNKINEDYAELEMKYKNNLDEILSLGTKNRSLSEELKMLENERNDLESSLQDAFEENKALKKVKNEVNEKLKVALESKNQINLEKTKLSQEFTKLETVNKTLQASFEDMKSKVEEYEIENKSLLRICENLKERETYLIKDYEIQLLETKKLEKMEKEKLIEECEYKLVEIKKIAKYEKQDMIKEYNDKLLETEYLMKDYKIQLLETKKLNEMETKQLLQEFEYKLVEIKKIANDEKQDMIKEYKDKLLETEKMAENEKTKLIENLKVKLDESETANQVLRTERKELITKLKESENNHKESVINLQNDYDNKLSNNELQINELSEKIKLNNECLENKEKIIIENENRIKTLKEKLKEKTFENEELLNIYQSIESSLITGLCDQYINSGNITNKITYLVQLKTDNEKKVEELSAIIANHEANLLDKEAKLSSLVKDEDKFNLLIQENENLKSFLANLKEEYFIKEKEMIAENENLAKKVEESKMKVKNIQVEFETFKVKSAEESEVKINEFKEEFEHFKFKIAEENEMKLKNIKKDSETFKVKIDEESEMKIKNIKKEYEIVKENDAQTILNLENQIAESEQRGKKASEEYRYKYENVSKEFELFKEKYLKEVEELREKIDLNEDKLKEVSLEKKNDIKNFEDNFNKLNIERENLITLLNNSKEENEVAFKKLEAVQSSYQSAKEQISNFENEVHNLNENLFNKEKEINELKLKIEKLENKKTLMITEKQQIFEEFEKKVFDLENNLRENEQKLKALRDSYEEQLKEMSNQYEKNENNMKILIDKLQGEKIDYEEKVINLDKLNEEKEVLCKQLKGSEEMLNKIEKAHVARLRDVETEWQTKLRCELEKLQADHDRKLAETVSEREEEKAQLSSVGESYSRSLARRDAEVAELKDERDSFICTMEQQEGEHIQLREALEQEIEKQQQEIELLRKKLIDTQQQMEKQVLNMELSNADLRQKIDSLQGELNCLEGQTKVGESSMDERLLKQKSILKEEFQKQVSDLTRQVEAMAVVEKTHLKQISEVEASYGAIHLKLSSAQEERDVVNKNYEIKDKLCSELALQVEDLRSGLEEADAEKYMRKEQVIELTTKLIAVNDRCSLLMSEIEKLNDEIDHFKGQIESINFSRTTLITDLQKAKEQNDRANAQFKKFSEFPLKIKSLEEQIEFLNNSKSSISQELQFSKEENSSLSDRIVNLEYELNICKENLSKYEEAFNEIKSSTEFTSSVNLKNPFDIKSILISLSSERENLKEKLLKENNKTEQLNIELQNVKENLNDFIQRIKEKDDEVNSLSSQLKETKENLEVVRQQSTVVPVEDQLISTSCKETQNERTFTEQDIEDSINRCKAELNLEHESQINELRSTHNNRYQEQESVWESKLTEMVKQNERDMQDKLDRLTAERVKERNELERLTQVATEAFKTGTDSVDLLKKQVTAQRKELEDIKHSHRKEVSELRELLEVKRRRGKGNHGEVKLGGSLEEAAEFEYLKNILYQYMIGKETQTLSKVLCAVVKFSKEQQRQIVEHEDTKLTLLKAEDERGNEKECNVCPPTDIS